MIRPERSRDSGKVEGRFVYGTEDHSSSAQRDNKEIYDH
jgi:hypothetical protein